MLAGRNLHFEPLFGILDFCECIYKFSVNLSLGSSIFLLGLMLKKYDGLHKLTFWASVRQSGFQRTHIQIVGESLFCNAYFLLGLLLRNMMAYRKSHSGHLFDILDFSGASQFWKFIFSIGACAEKI